MVSVKEIQSKSTSSSTSTNNGSNSNGVVISKSNNQNTISNIDNSNKSLKKIKNNDANDDEFNDFDPSEELQYGPGIVSKLRCRYLSLALRQSTGKQRLTLDNLRRATSLNNLLDGSTSNSVGKIIGAGSTRVIVSSNQTRNKHVKCSAIINDMIDENNDYEPLIINSNHNHYVNSPYNQKIFNQSQNEIENNLKEILDSEVIATKDSNLVNCTNIIETDIVLTKVNEFVEKPDQQHLKDSFINKNWNSQQTSTVAIPFHEGKTSVSTYFLDKNYDKTGCNENNDGNHNCNNNLFTNQCKISTAAAGIFRSGRQIKRGNDSIKRARSVEALLCEKADLFSDSIEDKSLNDKKLFDVTLMNQSELKEKNCVKNDNVMSISAEPAIHWSTNSNNNSCRSPTHENTSPILKEFTIEDKILNAKEHRKHETHPPKRLTSIIDDTERPPPDVVKQTLKIFEASANRRGGRGASKSLQIGQVAMKVANYKSITSFEQKPLIAYPKPPLSPKRLTSVNVTMNGVKSKPITLNIQNANVSPNSRMLSQKSPKICSPVSNLAKKFNNQIPDELSNDNATQLNNNASPKILNTIVKSPHFAKNRKESTPIKTTYVRPPDIVPRKVFNNNVGISPVFDIKNQFSSTGPISNADDTPITQLTKKIERLKIEGTPLTMSSVSSHIIKSNIHTSHQTNNSLKIESYGCENDNEIFNTIGDENYEVDEIDDKIVAKKISKIALENISKAGSSQSFSFKNVATSPLGALKTNLKAAEQTASTTNTKQIGIIRPLVAEPKLIDGVTVANTHLVNNSSSDNLKISSLEYDEMVKQQFNENVEVSRAQKRFSKESANDHEILSIQVLNHIQSKQDNSQKYLDNEENFTSSLESNTIEYKNAKPTLTSREIEKNFINDKKNEQANLDFASTSAQAHSLVVGNNKELNNWQYQLTQKKKISNYVNNSGPVEAQNNIMVFNFKDRKEVPDYIENDGLYISNRKRELPKPNESGFVLLGDLSLETSTDTDDSWTMGPPSPCNVEFENAYIIIDGKSSLRYRSKDGSLRVQFDDTLTSTFEYPSESSLQDDYVLSPIDKLYTKSNPLEEKKPCAQHVQVDEIIPINPIQTASSTTTTISKTLGNLPIGSLPLGSYTPIKLQFQSNFELGVTRVPNAIDERNINNIVLGEEQNVVNSYNRIIIINECKNIESTNEKYSNNLINDKDNLTEPENLHYLKPATDDLTVVYSEGTQETDLLY